VKICDDRFFYTQATSLPSSHACNLSSILLAGVVEDYFAIGVTLTLASLGCPRTGAAVVGTLSVQSAIALSFRVAF